MTDMNPDNWGDTPPTEDPPGGVWINVLRVPESDIEGDHPDPRQFLPYRRMDTTTLLAQAQCGDQGAADYLNSLSADELDALGERSFGSEG